MSHKQTFGFVVVFYQFISADLYQLLIFFINLTGCLEIKWIHELFLKIDLFEKGFSHQPQNCLQPMDVW